MIYYIMRLYLCGGFGSFQPTVSANDKTKQSEFAGKSFLSLTTTSWTLDL